MGSNYTIVWVQRPGTSIKYKEFSKKEIEQDIPRRFEMRAEEQIEKILDEIDRLADEESELLLERKGNL